jgi:hypothetical protein
MGVKIGYGSSRFPMRALVYSSGSVVAAKAGATLSTGVTCRYMIADRFGIESGAWINHYSFYREDNFRARDAYWKSAAESEVFNYQMPVVFSYKFKTRRHPFRYLILGAGTTIDWFSSYWVLPIEGPLRPQGLKNCFGAIRLGRERMRGKIEVGFEFQYSLKHNKFSHVNFTPDDSVVSKLNMISFVVNYFFLNKVKRNAEVLSGRS